MLARLKLVVRPLTSTYFPLTPSSSDTLTSQQYDVAERLILGKHDGIKALVHLGRGSMKKKTTKKNNSKNEQTNKQKADIFGIILPDTLKVSFTSILHSKTITSSLMLTHSCHLHGFYFIRGKGNFMTFLKYKQQALVKCFSNVLLLI